MKSSSNPEVKRTLTENSEQVLRVKFLNEDVLVLELDGEIDASTYDEDGIWQCWILDAVQGKEENFHKLFKPGSGLDIRECDVKEIVDEESGVTIYGTP